MNKQTFTIVSCFDCPLHVLWLVFDVHVFFNLLLSLHFHFHLSESISPELTWLRIRTTSCRVINGFQLNKFRPTSKYQKYRHRCLYLYNHTNEVMIWIWASKHYLHHRCCPPLFKRIFKCAEIIFEFFVRCEKN